MTTQQLQQADSKRYFHCDIRRRTRKPRQKRWTGIQFKCVSCGKVDTYAKELTYRQLQGELRRKKLCTDCDNADKGLYRGPALVSLSGSQE